MSTEMLLKLLWTINLPALSMSFKFLKEISNSTDRNIGETKMITRLIVESKRPTVLLMDIKSEIIESFLRSSEVQVTVEVNDLKTFTKFTNKEFRKIGATILHLDEYIEFESFFGLIKKDMFFYDGHFIIIYNSGNVREIKQIFSTLWQIYIYNVAVLVTNAASSDLVPIFTFLPFINGSCNNTEPIRINEFNITSMAWTTNLFFPKKFQQLNRCPLRFGCYNNAPGFIIKRSESGLPIFTGVNVDIVNMISDMLNFSLNFSEYEQDMGVIHQNKTATALLQRVIGNEVDLIFTSIYLDRNELLSVTRMVYADKLILVVPPPFLIGPMEKIFLPFSFVSWISIGMVALLACCTVITLKFTPKIVHDYTIT